MTGRPVRLEHAHRLELIGDGEADASLTQDLTLEVSLPYGYDPAGPAYPVVYLLDGHWYFPIISQALRLIGMDRRVRPVIVAGLRYRRTGRSEPWEEERILALRCRDLTPFAERRDAWLHAAGSPRGPGIEHAGAERFLCFIEQVVKPAIQQAFRVDPADATLAGFSLGGLCTLYSLFEHPGRFKRYVAGSPALWWGEAALLERALVAERAEMCGERRLFLFVGGREEEGSLQPFGMLSHLERLTQILRERPVAGLRWSSAVLEGDDHSTAAAVGLIKGLVSVLDSR